MGKVVQKAEKPLEIIEYCKQMNIDEDSAWKMIENGQLLCRMHSGQVIILESEDSYQADSKLGNKLITASTEPNHIETLARETLDTVKKLEKKFVGAISKQEASSSELQQQENADSIKKDQLIKKLRHDMEDITILNNTLQSQLNTRK